MISCNWRQRAGFALLLALVFVLHGLAFADVENSPAGMLVYHGSAMLGDYALLRAAPSALDGRILDDIERLCLASMCLNFLGWIAYLAYASPVIYDISIMVVTYVQFLRLILDSDDALSLWDRMVRVFHFRRTPSHP